MRIFEAKIFTILSLRQLRSMGKLIMSLALSQTKVDAWSINLSILRKSADMKIEMQFLRSRSGGLAFIGPEYSFYCY
jgi:hypothetical protein